MCMVKDRFRQWNNAKKERSITPTWLFETLNLVYIKRTRRVSKRNDSNFLEVIKSVKIVGKCVAAQNNPFLKYYKRLDRIDNQIECFVKWEVIRSRVVTIHDRKPIVECKYIALTTCVVSRGITLVEANRIRGVSSLRERLWPVSSETIWCSIGCIHKTIGIS